MMTKRNTKRVSMSPNEDNNDDDDASRSNSSRCRDRIIHNDNSNCYAHTVDFAGAVTGFGSSPNTESVGTDSDSDDFDFRENGGVKDNGILNRRNNGVGGNRVSRVTFSDVRNKEDDYGRTSLIDSKNFGRPSSETFATSSMRSTGSVDDMFKHMQNMERQMQSLQREVGKVSQETSAEISILSKKSRRSDMIRTSLILKDVDFQDDLQSSDTRYPADCYSLIALNGPRGFSWPRKQFMLFFFGFLVWFFQMSFLVMMLLSRMSQNASDIEIDNPIQDIWKFIPPNSKQVIRVSQIITLLTYTLFPDASLMDVFRAYQYFPNFRKATKDDPVYCMVVSCILRGLQGKFATFAVFLVVITTPSVVDIILNFTALSFISSLDDEAFALAKSGVFGKSLRDEVERIENAKLPACFRPKSTLKLYWKVMGTMGITLFTLLFTVIFFQNSSAWWVTKILRVQFKEETGLRDYSGCYKLNSNAKVVKRFVYTDGSSDVAFGYCSEVRRWILFKEYEDGMDPCDAKEENQLVRSSETQFFDIAKLYEELWFYPLSTTPVDLFFFPDSDEEQLYCNMTLGDGHCDQPLNIPGFQYDNGDCCAATCNHPDCARDGYTSGFGSSIANHSLGLGYPHCKNPQMKPITIHLNDIVSSRDPLFEEHWSPACKLDLAKGEDEWRAASPQKPLIWMRCDDAMIMTLNIDESMKNHAETVWVADGADCSFGIRNTTSLGVSGGKEVELYSFYCDDPIWFVNHTLFLGDSNSTETDQVEIFTRHSSEYYGSSFRRIPECYVEKLGEFIDTKTIYSPSNPSYEVIHWLLEDNSNENEVLECENELFSERFALSTMIFAMNGNDTMLLNNTEQQCYWSWIKCLELGYVNSLFLQNSTLNGQIPKELKLLKHLKHLNLYKNNITSITSEIGDFEKLQELWLHDNSITSIPSEIGLVENLETLWLYNNEIKSIPSEIGLLTNLRDLELGSNKLTSIPSEIGLMTNLEALWLWENQLTLVPTEIGLLKDLEFFWTDGNKIASLPSEFGLLTNLKAINLGSNNFSTFPAELAFLTNLKEIWYCSSNATNLPSEIWKMTDLSRLMFDDNQITSLPSAIGLMSHLRNLDLSSNQIAAIPSDIALLTDLRSLHLNQNMIKSIPTEIGLLSNLEEIHLDDNAISLLPSEIGSLSNLKVLSLNDNLLSGGAIPQEVEELCSSDDAIRCELGIAQPERNPPPIVVVESIGFDP